MDDHATPEYIRRAVKKYQAKFKELKIRVLPEDQEQIVTHAKLAGDASTTAFILRAIKETMARDQTLLPQFRENQAGAQINDEINK